MVDTGRNGRSNTDNSLEFLTELASVIDSLGKPEFYQELSKNLAHFLDSKRFLAIRYAQYARPEFLVNKAMSDAAVDSYNREYYRIDPLLRMVRDEATRPVVTFDELRRNGPDTFFYDEMFRTADIRDELVFLLPTIGGVFTAICIDRSRRYFSEAEILQSRLIYPTLRRIHELHTRQILYGQIGGTSSNDETPMLILDIEGRILFRNTSKIGSLESDIEKSINKISDISRNGSEQISDQMILHWEILDTAHSIAPGGKAVVLERVSPGYLDMASQDVIQRFSTMYNLTPRETEIITHVLEGQTTAKISEFMNISAGTVRNHKHKLYYKLDITTERELFCMMFDTIVKL